MKLKGLLLGLLVILGATAYGQTIDKQFKGYTETAGLVYTGKITGLVGDSVKIYLDGMWAGAPGLDNSVVDTLGNAFVNATGEVTISVSKHPSRIAPRFVDSVGTSTRFGYLDWTAFDGQTVYFTYKMSSNATANKYDIEFAIYAVLVDNRYTYFK